MCCAQTGENVSYEFDEPSQRTVAGVESETRPSPYVRAKRTEFTMNQTMLV